MTVDPRWLLADVHGGRVLDVATGYGGFIPVLADGLADYDEIVGIEFDAARQARFEAATAGRRAVTFVHGDFLRSTYAPGSFDTVAVSASLHHFVDAALVLRRMLEIVAPGGTVIVSEMYRDDQTAAQETEVAVHDWMAEVDTATGGVHRPTFRRPEIIALVDDLNLEHVRMTDRADLLIDPHDQSAVAEISDMIDRYAVKGAGIVGLEERVTELRERLADVGVQEATILTLVGRRPAV
jgi:SAM-dependent methyltransferase